jgi:long-chain acyl-CoA synthetase
MVWLLSGNTRAPVSDVASINVAAARTLGSVLRETALAHGDRPAMVTDERTWTWSELDVEVDRLASLLVSVGIAPGDAVGFLITKRPEVVTGFLALARIGAIMSPINFKLHADHVRDQVQTAQITAVFVESRFDGVLKGLLPLLPDPRRIIYVDGPGRHGTTHLDDLAQQPRLSSAPAVHPDTPCYYNFTSGTTGRPKGAVTTHRHILANAIATATPFGFTQDDVFLGMFSVFSHPHELFHRSLMVGGAFMVLNTLSPRVVAEAVERHRISWMMAVPSFYEMLLDFSGAEGERGQRDLRSLRVLEAGGAHVGEATLRRMEARFDARFMPVWGCTEASGVALANGATDERRPGATGRSVPGYEIRVVDEKGRDVAPDTVGEMVLRGPAVVSEYINNPDETSALFCDGWYYTRDLVRCDADGWFHFVGRRSEMLKIGGIRVYPLEIEKVIKDHPEVRDVVVVRAEERVRGEVARAVVSTVSGSRLDARTLRAYCRDRLAVYKVPRIVEFWRDVPKLPNGKIDKRAVVTVVPDPGRDERAASDAI